MIAIVDYNMGNLASVKNAFAKLGEDTVVESDPAKFFYLELARLVMLWSIFANVI